MQKHSRSSALLQYKDFKIYTKDEQFLRKSEESTQISIQSKSPNDLMLSSIFCEAVDCIHRVQASRQGRKEKDKRNLKEKVLAEFFKRGSSRKFKNDKKIKKKKGFTAIDKNNKRRETLSVSMKEGDSNFMEKGLIIPRGKRVSLLLGNF